MPLWASTGYENGVSNTTVSDEMVEITFLGIVATWRASAESQPS